MSARTLGVETIALERARQIEKGYDQAHDAEHDAGEFTSAALAYLTFANWQIDPHHGWTRDMLDEHIMENLWPWDERDFKPGDPARNLAKAGALIAAEIDRNATIAKALGRAAPGQGYPTMEQVDAAGLDTLVGWSRNLPSPNDANRPTLERILARQAELRAADPAAFTRASKNVGWDR